MDAVYEVSTGVLAHTGDTLTVTFGAMNLQTISDESWGIDDFEVVLDVPEPSTLVFMVLAGVLITRRS